jgi:hypothetical protein
MNNSFKMPLFELNQIRKIKNKSIQIELNSNIKQNPNRSFYSGERWSKRQDYQFNHRFENLRLDVYVFLCISFLCCLSKTIFM